MRTDRTAWKWRKTRLGDGGRQMRITRDGMWWMVVKHGREGCTMG